MKFVTRRPGGQSGFTLIEIAIVLLIVVIILGYTVAMFPLQQELKQYRQAEADMDSIIEHLVGFAQVRGRLPCPDTNAGVGTIDGVEDPNGATDCLAYFGFIPGRTLGIEGRYASDGRLIDPWGQGYRYALSNVDASLDGEFDLVTANEIREEGLAALALTPPDLSLCDDSNATGDDLNCGDVSGGPVIENVAVVIVSLGKNFGITSNIQDENADNFHDGTLDKVYIFSPRRDDYDDIVKWISPNLLFSKMIEADQLP